VSNSHRRPGIPEDVRETVFERDQWRCQFCGSMRNLEIHHLRFRSHGGRHTPENLIALCTKCHSRLHRRGR
jgi:5-methylcytosine-specific restriction endonuclease McrA